jgi:non-specific serine/threonine protein kinase
MERPDRLSASRSVPPQRRAPRARLPHLPAPLTSFVGRTREITSLAGLLAETRLLTLTGIGGIGKSRLALEVARAALADDLTEACLVELAAVAAPGDVVGAVAAALGVQESLGRSLLDGLVTGLADRDLVLVLDNCEHIVEATAELAEELLRRCPDLRVLATSRVALDVSGEVTWPVGPLPVPDLARAPARPALARVPAVRLFVDRARAARPAFSLTDQNAEEVARIAVRLDGIPLAIELAAALVSVLSPRQIGERLDDRFRLLAAGGSAGGRTTMPRHRTLRALVDWSHDLLDAPTQTIFRRLAVFAGGWTLEAAEMVCGDPSAGPEHAVDRADVLDALARLVAASLVVADQSQEETRFGLLETIREYTLGKLRDSGEEDLIRQRHLAWMLALARQAEPLLWTSAQRTWLARLDQELENLRAALAWSAGPGDVDAGRWIVALLWRFWEQRGHAAEARRWLGGLLDRPDASSGPGRARALLADAYFAHHVGDLAAAQTRATEGLALAEAGDDPITLIYGLLTLAIMRGTTGDLAEAEAGLERALIEARRTGWDVGVRMATVDLGILARIRDDPALAVARFDEARAMSEAAGDAYAQAFCFTNLAHLALQQGEWDASAGWYRRSLAIWRDFQDTHNVASILEGLAWPISAQGRAEHAARLFGAAETLRTVVGTVILPHWQADHDRAEAAARAALGEEAFAAAWAAGRALTFEQAIDLGLASDDSARSVTGRATGVRGQAVPGALSAREVEVARLVARGLTNREIADALVLQPSTVGNHLQRIYARLGLAGRAQLATWVAEHDRPDDLPT